MWGEGGMTRRVVNWTTTNCPSYNPSRLIEYHKPMTLLMYAEAKRQSYHRFLLPSKERQCFVCTPYHCQRGSRRNNGPSITRQAITLQLAFGIDIKTALNSLYSYYGTP